MVADVPIIMVTALNDRASRLIGIEAGADDFIDKPFDTVELRARVRTIVRLNRFRRLIAERQRADLLEEERQRLVYDLHDNLAQRVSSVHQQLQAFAHRHPPRSKQTKEELGAILELARSATRDAQLMTSLQPEVQENVGLATALRMQIEELQAEGWDITFDDGLDGQRLSANAEATLFKVAHEALTNVRKHAGTQRVRALPPTCGIVCAPRSARLGPRLRPDHRRQSPTERRHRIAQHAKPDATRRWNPRDLHSTWRGRQGCCRTASVESSESSRTYSTVTGQLRPQQPT